MVIKINSIQELLDILEDHTNSDSPHTFIRYWFRGHGDENYELLPTVYRKGFYISKFTEEPDSQMEENRLKREQHLNKEFRVQASQIIRDQIDDTRLYFLQRHYGMPTRLLDWSTNVLVGLYFAVSNTEKDDLNGKFFILDAYELTEKQGQQQFGIASSKNPTLEKAIETIGKWKCIHNFPDFTFPVIPDQFEKRIALQNGRFTFHVPKMRKINETEEYITTILIPKEAKKLIRNQLMRLGINEFTIYGDLGSLAKALPSLI